MCQSLQRIIVPWYCIWNKLKKFKFSKFNKFQTDNHDVCIHNLRTLEEVYTVDNNYFRYFIIQITVIGVVLEWNFVCPAIVRPRPYDVFSRTMRQTYTLELWWVYVDWSASKDTQTNIITCIYIYTPTPYKYNIFAQNDCGQFHFSLFFRPS